MKALTIEKILNDYQEFLSDREIENLKQVHKGGTDFETQVRELQKALFWEEWDIEDFEEDAPETDIGIVTDYQKYVERVNKKRVNFGVSELSEVGYPRDNSSTLLCEELVRHSKNYKELLDLKRTNKKQIVFVDMDGVLVNFQSGIDKISKEDYEKYGPLHFDEVPGIFSLMEPMEGAIEAYQWLCEHFDTYILSTAPWDNPSAWIDKLLWVKKYLPKEAYKRLTLTHNKHLAAGHFLIDDRTANGAEDFGGKHIHYGPEGHKDFGDWKAVISYMKNLA